MKRIDTLLGLAALLAACSSPPAGLAPQPSTPRPGPGTPDLASVGGHRAAAGEVLVKYRNAVAPASVRPLAGSRVVSRFGGSGWGSLARVAVPRGRELEYAGSYAAAPGVEYAEPNYWVENPGRRATALGLPRVGAPSGPVRPLALPDPITDPYYLTVPPGNAFDTTGVDGTVYTGETYQWHIKRVRAPEAWAAGYTGAGVVIASIDEGVDLEHPDLKANLWVNPNPADPDCPGAHGYDFTDDDADPTDGGGHGTHTVGTFTAAANGQGVVGVAPEAKVMALRGLGYFGGTAYMLVRALKYAADCGAQVANNSWGGSYRSAAYDDVIRYGVSKGTTYVFSAMNNYLPGNAPAYPAGYSTAIAGLIGVGATSNDNRRVAFSNTGPYVTVSAPGAAVMSTIPVAQGGYSFLAGTSMAAPHVAGVVALVYQAYRTGHGGTDPSPAQARIILEQTANSRLTAQPSRPDWPAGGQHGYGLVDAKAAVDYARTQTP